MVMRNAFITDIYREIMATKGRFLGILSIVLLGVAFFSGLGATGHDMRLTGQVYFDALSLMDIKVVSTFGLNERDINAIRSVPGVTYLYPAYSMDAQATHNGDAGNIKLLSYHPDAGMNKPLLVSGTLPQKINEAVVEAELLRSLGYAVGDRITISSGKTSDIRNNLRNNTYLITGVVRSPLYISQERGTSSIGRGVVDFYMYIPQDNFLSDIYTEAYLRVEGTDGLPCFGDEYKDKIKAVKTTIEDVGKWRVEERVREMTASAYRKLHEAETALDENIRHTQLTLDESETALTEALRQLPEEHTRLGESLTEILLREQETDESLAQLTASLSALREAEAELDAQEGQLHTSNAEVMENEPYLGAEFTERLRDIADGLDAVAAARRTVEEQKQQLYAAMNTLTEARQQLQDTRNTLYEANRALVTGGYTLMETETELNAERLRLTAQLDDARAQLTQTREDLDDLDDPTWYVLDRDGNPGYASFSDDSDKIEAIGRVFPLIFFIVAALVCLTTMTRLVEERRTEIGTLKSLGYGNATIISKYLIYAVAPTLIGGLIGGYGGMLLFPNIIIDAYNMMYSMPSPVTPVQPFYWTVGLLMGLAATGLSTLFACINELRETPGGLLRPKAPKSGKRTIFEKITVLWRALSFTHKVTIRNLLRYKKRMLMTVIGIGGCTALLLTGFGVYDSVSGITGKQFGDILLYDMAVSFSDSAREKDINRAADVLAADGIYRRAMKVRQKSMDAATVGGTLVYQASLIVPESTGGFEHMFTFRNRATHEPYTLNDDGVIITEKLSRLLDVKPGERIEIRDGDEIRVNVRVSAVTEMYFMHYIYMSPELYRQVFDENPESNGIFALIKTDSPALENELAQKLLDEKNVNGVHFVQSSVDNFTDIVNNLNFVVFVLIISAGALALVVLLNLTNININERMRELATIEVLGFYDLETALYIYRENAVLTVLGTVLGLVLGYFLHLYVILTVETEIMMFSRDIKPTSFFYSVALTVCFALIVNLLTAGKLRKINMVEALKSVE